MRGRHPKCAQTDAARFAALLENVMRAGPLHEGTKNRAADAASLVKRTMSLFQSKITIVPRLNKQAVSLKERDRDPPFTHKKCDEM